MNTYLKYIFYTVTPRIVDGLVAVVLLPILLTGYRYTFRASSQIRPTQTIVCQSEAGKKIDKVKMTSSLILPFHKTGLLSVLEAEDLGPRIFRINPMLTQGFMRANSGTSLGKLTQPLDTLPLGEDVSLREQIVVESELDLSDSAESLDLSNDSIDFSNYPESLDLAIIEKQNLLKQVLRDYQNLNSRIYEILTVVSENWDEVDTAYTPAPPNFKVYDNPWYEPNDLDVSSSVYFGIVSGRKRLFHKILELAGLEKRIKESARQRDRLAEDIERDGKLFCHRILALEHEFKDNYLIPAAELAIERYFENLNSQIKRGDLVLQESDEQTLVCDLEKLKTAIRLIIRQNRDLRREVIREIENYFLKNSRITLQRQQHAINSLRQEIALLEENKSNPE